MSLPELPDPSEYVEIEEAARLLHVSKSHLHRVLYMNRWPELRAVKITTRGRGKWLIPKSGIAARFAAVERERYGAIRPMTPPAGIALAREAMQVVNERETQKVSPWPTR